MSREELTPHSYVGGPMTDTCFSCLKNRDHKVHTPVQAAESKPDNEWLAYSYTSNVAERIARFIRGMALRKRHKS